MFGSIQRRRHVGRRSSLGAVALTLLLVAGCTGGVLPRPQSDDPERAATELAAGLRKKDLTGVEFVAAPSTEVNAAFQTLARGMGPLTPTVHVVKIDRQGSGARATLNLTWTFPGVGEKWTYSSTAQLQNDSGRWKTAWQASVLHPRLNGSNRLSQRRLAADRGEVLGADDDAIVTDRPVVRIGIDKTAVQGQAAEASAIKLAKLVGIKPKTYAALVAGAGEDAFVEAITLRADDEDRPANSQVLAISGALPIQGEQMLAPTRDFARPILGTVGEATKEIVEDSDGTIVAGDQVGLSGLQQRYDRSLRGTPGAQVRLLPLSAGPAASSGPGSLSPGPTPSPSLGSTPSPAPAVTVFSAEPTAGQDLHLTLNVFLQELAEETLADTGPASALVAIRPSTGAIAAAANGPGNANQNLATIGQAAPGSTFKVASALALLRVGLTPSSKVRCPKFLTVDGRRFTNYSDYPSSSLGTITLRTALAQSCNTAFIGARTKLDDGDLAEAAASLGMGVDYDTGFGSYFGEVPDDASGTGGAAAMIGQGTVLASPMAMASVVASVSAERTIVPVLVSDQTAKATAQPLTKQEAKALTSLMRSVVTDGSGRSLADLPGPGVIAKTGTAEYGNAKPLKTHAWMIAAQGDLAVAVFVNDGQSGSKTAGPLLKEFLRKSR
ncbi:MAG: penicillin-binding protein [Microlunatus sp.]|nr:penicillin-binding protein [Microlunatus sp.]MDN5770645.1 penicillin-binding protein [Microlunatus sp.]MDN5803797.1 penicillin-binding protein [Microlunatus sp.]